MTTIDFLYEYNEDTLYLYKDTKTYGSIEFGEDVVVDFDKQMNVVALEFFQASKTLSYLTNNKITKKMLEKIKEVKLVSENKGRIIKAMFQIKMDTIEIKDKLILQDSNYKSPVLAAITAKSK